MQGSQEPIGLADNDTATLAKSLIQVMGSRAAFETCMNSQWFDVAEQIYRLSLMDKSEPTT